VHCTRLTQAANPAATEVVVSVLVEEMLHLLPVRSHGQLPHYSIVSCADARQAVTPERTRLSVRSVDSVPREREYASMDMTDSCFGLDLNEANG